MRVFKAKVKIHFPQGTTLGEMLMKISGLDSPKVTDAAQKGAVWLQRQGKGKILKARDIRIILRPEDLVTFNYDVRILSLKVTELPTLVSESKHYGVWYKPAGMVTQGTQTGDHTLFFALWKQRSEKSPTSSIDSTGRRWD